MHGEPRTPRSPLGASDDSAPLLSDRLLEDSKAAFPENLYPGESTDDGDNFFDTIAKGLNGLPRRSGHTVKSLRTICDQYAKGLDDENDWIKREFDQAGLYDAGAHQDYLTRIQFTEQEIAQHRESKMMPDQHALQGILAVDGRIIAQKLGVTLHVIEESKRVHTLVTKDGVRHVSADSIDYEGENIIHVAIVGGKYRPLLDRKDQTLMLMNQALMRGGLGRDSARDRDEKPDSGEFSLANPLLPFVEGHQPRERLRFSAAMCEVMKLVAPYTASLLTSMVGEILLIKIISDIGEDELASTGLIGFSQSIFVSPLIAILSGVNYFAGQNMNTNPRAVGVYYRQYLLLAFLFSIPLVLTSFFMGKILTAFGQDQYLSDLAQEAFYGRSIGLPFMLGLAVNQRMTLGLSLPWIATFSTIFDILLTPALSYPLGNRYKMRGFGFAIALSAIINFLITTIYLAISKSYRVYQLFDCRTGECRSKILPILKFGIPIGLQNLIESASLSVPILFVGRMGNDALLAQQTVIPFFNVFSMPYVATSDAIIGNVGNKHKRGEVDNLWQFSKAALILCLGTSMIGFLLFAFFYRQFASFLINIDVPENSYVMKLVKVLFLVHGAELAVDSVKAVSTGLIRGLGNSAHPSIISGVTTILCIGLGYVLGFTANWGVAGVYIGRDVGLTVAAMLLFRKWWHAHQEPYAGDDVNIRAQSPPVYNGGDAPVQSMHRIASDSILTNRTISQPRTSVWTSGQSFLTAGTPGRMQLPTVRRNQGPSHLRTFTT